MLHIAGVNGLNAMKNKDLCKRCEHYWVDYPIILGGGMDTAISHCDINDKKSQKSLDEIVEYPCTECPYNSFVKKKV